MRSDRIDFLLTGQKDTINKGMNRNEEEISDEGMESNRCSQLMSSTFFSLLFHSDFYCHLEAEYVSDIFFFYL